MPTNAEGLTLALILTAGGSVAAAALVTGLVQLLKAALPIMVSRAWEFRAALVASGVLVITATVSQVQAGALQLTLESGFAAVLAWYAIARLAKAFYDDATGAEGSLRPAPPTPGGTS